MKQSLSNHMHMWTTLLLVYMRHLVFKLYIDARESPCLYIPYGSSPYS